MAACRPYRGFQRSGRASLAPVVVYLAAALTAPAGGRDERGTRAVRPDIVFTQTPAQGSGEPRLVRRLPDGKLRILSEGFHAARDPEVSFDGKRILFAGKKLAADFWQIYEIGADGSGLRQVTREPMDCRQPLYQSLSYVLTADEPWYQVAFRGQAAGDEPQLYSVRLDGTALRQLTFNPCGAWDPLLMYDGRILFVARQSYRIEPGPKDRAGLFGVNLDGTDYAVFTADQGAPHKRMPAMTAREVVFVENDRFSPDGGGWLAAVALRRPLYSHRRITRPEDGHFHSPSPLPDGHLLVARRTGAPGSTYGLWRLDPAAPKPVLVFDDPDRDDFQARLLAPRPEPDGFSSVVDDNERTGVLYCLSVHTTDFRDPGWMPPGAAKRLRVLEGVPRRAARAGDPPPPPLARVLGEVAVDEDGSFNVRVPANIPIQLQLLDEQGLALRSCSWIWTKNKSHQGCIGCHEDPELVPENRMAMAVMRPPMDLTLPAERRRLVSFEKSVKPIFEKSCAMGACHGGSVPPRLLDPDALRVHLAGSARTSPLVWHLLGRNTSRPWDPPVVTNPGVERMPPAGSAPLSDDDRRTIMEWVDMGAER